MAPRKPAKPAARRKTPARLKTSGARPAPVVWWRVKFEWKSGVVSYTAPTRYRAIAESLIAEGRALANAPAVTLEIAQGGKHAPDSGVKFAPVLDAA